MKVVGVIPARYEVTRLPGKVLADIAGRPMIEHVYRRAGQAESLDELLVATDDERIARVVRDFGDSASSVETLRMYDSSGDQVSVDGDLNSIFVQASVRGTRFRVTEFEGPNGFLATPV